MKILYVNGKNNNGGANIALLNIIRGMMSIGHEVHVVTDKDPGFFLDEVNKTGCHIHTCRCDLNIKVASYVRNPITIFNYYIIRFLDWYRQKKYIRHIIKEISPEIVHTNIGPLTTAAELCKEMGIPHVWHLREYGEALGFRVFPSDSHFKELLKDNNNYCIAITKGIFKYNYLRNNHDCYIYDGVFPQAMINQQEIKKKENYILFVGRIEKAKGVKELLEAYSIFHNKDPKFNLILAGGYDKNSKYYCDCLNFIESENLKEKVIFLGVRKDVYDLMSHARCLVVPSPMEGFGFITAEAMLNYCPVIGFDNYGTKEQFDNGVDWTGGEIAYRYHNKEELVSNMLKAVAENNDAMINRAHCAASNYTIEKNIVKIEDFYNKILNSWGC